VKRLSCFFVNLDKVCSGIVSGSS